jgi:phosphotriesterase-related protein
MQQKAITVLGEISPDELGFVLPHEHFLWDVRCVAHEEPSELWKREQFKQKISLENRGHVIYHTADYLDNLVQTDLNIAIEEANRFRLAGGGTICDLTLKNIGRDPKALRAIALSTGLNIIMGCGNYIASSWSEDENKMTEDQIKSKIIDEFTNGVDFSGIKPGILGEVGVSDIENVLEVKNLRGSGMAQNALGCPMNIHIPFWEKKGNKVLDILEEVGTDLNKVALSHLDETTEDADYQDSLAKRGAYIEYDQFGMYLMSCEHEGRFSPSDNERIKAVKEQIKRGNVEHILISQDICFKILLTKWGGHGYAHILENIVPRLRYEGLSEEQIKTILVENPKRFLSW